ncbi:hypothetical protein ABPG77_000440 [Micractinium sp. CCAP 211/92]
MLQQEPYTAPEWAASLEVVPTQRYRLAQLPTPVHPWAVPGLAPGCELHIKRDDLTGMQLSGNKVRKLEFLLAEAREKGHDSVITIGGIQSNHARATAVAARYLGLESHLILRNSDELLEKDPGLAGNLLVERLVGAHIWQLVSSQWLCLAATPPCPGHPFGCSYLDMMRELEQQIAGQCFTDIAVACGSSGTALGIALGNRLAGLGLRVHAYCICASPAFFYRHCDSLLAELGATPDVLGCCAEGLLRFVQAQGEGYAKSRAEELAHLVETAAATGVVVDPVYTGKALHGLVSEMRADPQAWAGRKVLFMHTGGLLGMYDKATQLEPLIQAAERTHRLVLE